MRSNFKVLALVACGALAWFGCESKTAPVGVYPAPVSTADRTIVVDFNSIPVSIMPTLILPPIQPPSGPLTDTNGFGVSLYPINPYLFEPIPGGVLLDPGRALVVNNFLTEAATMTVAGPGANNTALAAHILGYINDPGDSTYPAVDFQVPMESGSKYDMSFFTGVNFYYKTEVDDTVSKRVFQIPTLQTQAPPAGTCDNSSSKCYDHFSVTLPATNGSWKKFSIRFTDLTRQGFGWPMDPPNLTGQNLKEVIWLQWEESNNNTAGNVGVDFWVDEVQFFQ